MKKLPIYLMASVLAFSACDEDPYVNFEGEPMIPETPDVTAPELNLGIDVTEFQYGQGSLDFSVTLADDKELSEVAVKLIAPNNKFLLDEKEELDGTEKTLSFSVPMEFVPSMGEEFDGIAKVKVSAIDDAGKVINAEKSIQLSRPAVDNVFAVVNGEYVELTQDTENTQFWTVAVDYSEVTDVYLVNAATEEEVTLTWKHVDGKDALEVNNEEAQALAVGKGKGDLVFDFSTFELFLDYELTVPESLFLVGGGTDADWNPANALQMKETAEGEYEIYTRIGAGGFKFLPTNTGWDGDLGLDKRGKLADIDDEVNLDVAEEGFYRVRVNFATREVNVDLANFGVIGDATPTKWDSDTDMIIENSTTLSVDLDLVPGELKFRANDDWAINFGDNDADGSLEDGGSNLLFTEAGSYTIKLILDPTAEYYTYTITEKVPEVN